MFNHELGGKIMTEFFALRAKTYAYIIEDVSVHKRTKEEMHNKKRDYV